MRIGPVSLATHMLFLALLGVIALASLLLSGCASTEPQESPPPDALAPARGMEVHVDEWGAVWHCHTAKAADCLLIEPPVDRPDDELPGWRPPQPTDEEIA